MTFEEILDQAIAMLQRRGRLTYGALKRQFQLDDTYLADLTAELIEGQRLAVDEEGRVLVWTSAASPASSAPSSFTPTQEHAPLTYTRSYLAEKILRFHRIPTQMPLRAVCMRGRVQVYLHGRFSGKISTY